MHIIYNGQIITVIFWTFSRMIFALTILLSYKYCFRIIQTCSKDLFLSRNYTRLGTCRLQWCGPHIKINTKVIRDKIDNYPPQFSLFYYYFLFFFALLTVAEMKSQVSIRDVTIRTIRRLKLCCYLFKDVIYRQEFRVKQKP